MVYPVVLTVYKDRTFTFVTKTPPASFLIKKTIGLKKGSGNPLADKVGKITQAQLEEIAKIKMADLNARTIDAAVKIIAGTARNMGVEVVG
jgi:large subunit ribosomal protein L11